MQVSLKGVGISHLDSPRTCVGFFVSLLLKGCICRQGTVLVGQQKASACTFALIGCFSQKVLFGRRVQTSKFGQLNFILVGFYALIWTLEKILVKNKSVSVMVASLGSVYHVADCISARRVQHHKTPKYSAVVKNGRIV
ncbi:hypothetical protein BDW67DRAFT_57793 [Aspergillus spinulosporus]